jgi:hypothetical protein
MVSVVIIQPAPTACIQVPMYDPIAASHIERKSGSRKGAHAELCSAGIEGGRLVGVFTISAI